MIERSCESEWLDYVLANKKANRSYFEKMGRLHRAYTEQIARDVHNVVVLRREAV